MFRLVITLIGLAALAFGFAWLANMPGGLTLAVGDLRIDVPLPVALAALVLLFLVVWLLVFLVRLALGAPGLMSAARRARNAEKGRLALARGMIAAAAGDARAAERAGEEAARRLRENALVLLLEAQNAQLSGNRAAATKLFQRMAERPDMRLLGLRGLHAEALRKGESEAAHDFAARAHAIAPLPWAAQAVLERHTSRRDWPAALAAVDKSSMQKIIDRPTAERLRAVLLTAQALELGERDPDQVLKLSQEALRLAPDLAPAAVVAAGVLTRRQEIRKAARTIEACWRLLPHPDLARAYLDVRPGDSATDRLARAEILARIDRDHPESRMIVARAALEAREFLKARRAMAPLIGDGRPTRRMCLLMADIEEAEHGATGALREWLARAARAPRDPAWVADGVVSDVWAPVSPVTGRLDAYVWRTPEERLTALDSPPPEVLPAPERPASDPATAPAPIAPPAAPTIAYDESAGAPEAQSESGAEGFALSQRARAQPVLFPQPQAPDDPGLAPALDDDAGQEDRPIP